MAASRRSAPPPPPPPPPRAGPAPPPAALLQQLRHVPVIQRISGRRRHLPIGRHLPLRNRPDRLAERRVPLRALGRSPQKPLHLMPPQDSSAWRKQPVR